MDTMTKTITNAQIALATAVLFAASGAALIGLPELGRISRRGMTPQCVQLYNYCYSATTHRNKNQEYFCSQFINTCGVYYGYRPGQGYGYGLGMPPAPITPPNLLSGSLEVNKTTSVGAVVRLGTAQVPLATILLTAGPGEDIRIDDIEFTSVINPASSGATHATITNYRLLLNGRQIGSTVAGGTPYELWAGSQNYTHLIRFSGLQGFFIPTNTTQRLNILADVASPANGGAAPSFVQTYFTARSVYARGLVTGSTITRITTGGASNASFFTDIISIVP